MISRPYQVGQKVLSLVDSAYQEAAFESSAVVGLAGWLVGPDRLTGCEEVPLGLDVDPAEE